MASAGAGTDGAAGTAKKKKRIADCLVHSDGGDDVAGEDAAAPPSPPSPGTPRLRIPMFTCARLRLVRLGRKGGRGRKDVVVAEKSEAASTDSSGWKKGSNGAGGAEAAGMGLSLLFLLAKTCVELNKMAEVRARMEALLEEMRGLQLARTTKTTSTDSDAAAPGSINGLPPPSTTASLCRCRASVRTRKDGHVGAASSSSPESSGPRRFHERTDDESSFYALTGNPLFDLDRAAASTSGMETASGGCGTSSEMDDSVGMTVDAAGAQFFQLNNYNADEQETPEELSSDGDSFIELDGGFGAGVGSSARRRRDSEDGHDEERGSDEGVSALELEKRLQELLHRRSRERIEELEQSLRRAERKLMEKEMEARLWKDTAKLALQPPPPSQQQEKNEAVTFSR